MVEEVYEDSIEFRVKDGVFHVPIKAVLPYADISVCNHPLPNPASHAHLQPPAPALTRQPRSCQPHSTNVGYRLGERARSTRSHVCSDAALPYNSPCERWQAPGPVRVRLSACGIPQVSPRRLPASQAALLTTPLLDGGDGLGDGLAISQRLQLSTRLFSYAVCSGRG